MLLTIQQLVHFKMIPATNYKLGRAFPQGFKPAVSVTNELWKKLPLYIQVQYEYTPTDGIHKRKD